MHRLIGYTLVFIQKLTYQSLTHEEVLHDHRDRGEHSPEEDASVSERVEDSGISVYHIVGLGLFCLCVGALCVQKYDKSPKKRKDDVYTVHTESPMLEVVTDMSNSRPPDNHPLERVFIEEGGYRFLAALCEDPDILNQQHLAHDIVLLLYSVGCTPHILESTIELEASHINSSANQITFNNTSYPTNSNLFSPLLWRILRKYSLCVSRAYLKVTLSSVMTMADLLVASGEPIRLEDMRSLIAELVNNITDDSNIRILPKQVRRLCRALYVSVNRRMSGINGMAAGCVGHLLFSCLLASGLIAPHAHDLHKAPSPVFSGLMMQLAVALHHMGQGTLFGTSNPLLRLLNQQILESIPRMQKYLEHVSKFELQPQSDSPMNDPLGIVVSHAQRQQYIYTLTTVLGKIMPRLQKQRGGERFMETISGIRMESLSPLSGEVNFASDNIDEIAYAEFEKELDNASAASVNAIATSLEELPGAVQKIVLASGLHTDLINSNFAIVLNILHFKKLYPPRHLRPTLLSTSTLSSLDVHAIEQLISVVNPKRLYKNITQIGKGGFGRVYAARNDKGRRVAIKRVPHSASKERRRNLAEIRYLSTFKHPNIVQFITCHAHENELWIVMEYMAGGTLTQAAADGAFSEPQIAFVSRELLKAIEFLHSNGFVHRDLKSDNCMMTTKGEVKLIDFGLCLDIEKDGPRNHLVGSPFWMSPEMISRQPHSYATDIWSFGVCILELANHHAPNKDSYLRAMFVVATVGLPSPLERPGDWSPLFHEFLSMCLERNPESRPSASQLLQHAFIAQAASSQSMETLLTKVFVKNVLESSGMINV